MERDIHSALVPIASWTPSVPGHVVPTKLLTGMERRAREGQGTGCDVTLQDPALWLGVRLSETARVGAEH